jgi:hypothetical protein
MAYGKIDLKLAAVEVDRDGMQQRILALLTLSERLRHDIAELLQHDAELTRRVERMAWDSGALRETVGQLRLRIEILEAGVPELNAGQKTSKAP